MKIHLDKQAVSTARAAEIFRAMNGDQEAQKVVSLQDVEGLQNAPTFERFLAWNRENLATYENLDDAIERAR